MSMENGLSRKYKHSSPPFKINEFDFSINVIFQISDHFELNCCKLREQMNQRNERHRGLLLGWEELCSSFLD